MINTFKNIIQSTAEMYCKDSSHPSESMKKELKEDEMRVIKILDEIMNQKTCSHLRSKLLLNNVASYN
jgi:uncharacterized membrane protein